MPVSVFVLEDHDLLFVRLWGTIRLHDVLDIIDTYDSLPGFHPDIDRIVYVETGTDLSEIDAEATKAIADKTVSASSEPDAAGSAEPARYRTCFVSDNGINQYTIHFYREILADKTNTQVQSKEAPTLADALAWLERPPEVLDRLADHLGSAA